MKDYTLHIFCDLSVSCDKITTFQPWFTKLRYIDFSDKLEYIFKTKGSRFLHFYQFYIEFPTINSLVNISEELPYKWINSSVLTENAQTIYEYQTITNNYRITLQLVVNAMIDAETVFNDFFTNIITRAQLQVN